MKRLEEINWLSVLGSENFKDKNKSIIISIKIIIKLEILQLDIVERS